MNSKKMFLLLGWIGVSCGNSNVIEIAAPGISDGTLTVKSFETGEVLSQQQVHLMHDRMFGVAELGLGKGAFTIEISNAKYINDAGVEEVFEEGEKFTASLDGISQTKIINVNPLTTIADCFAHRQTIDLKASELIIQSIDNIMADQWNISTLQGVPSLLQDQTSAGLSEETKYEFLLKGLERVSSRLGWTLSGMTNRLCTDILTSGNVGVVDPNYSMVDQKIYDEQILKARLAGGIYEFYRSHDMVQPDSLVQSYANLVSTNHSKDIFTEDVQDFEFEIISPGSIIENSIPSGNVGSYLNLDVEVHDLQSNPTWVTVHVEFDTGENIPISNELSQGDHFMTNLSTAALPSGLAKICVHASDLFGNSTEWEYPVEF